MAGSTLVLQLGLNLLSAVSDCVNGFLPLQGHLRGEVYAKHLFMEW
ncbi:hypothetical protein NT26_p10037 (plasmid) [Pseudorhizobium banfieldiae]|uniref:Uncharacterized protein n=1 Tax=Pseudorhizobium banfieldiae TaxID=1125847 RepID=L0NNJ5_9HYPH|nr:hypothetical protein RNT25_04559 [arsenite-oxidising bacterium NT-25]CCF22062.1 hypothetical protein NT26_p10037 [Pseudorhizobium banfieldiae]